MNFPGWKFAKFHQLFKQTHYGHLFKMASIYQSLLFVFTDKEGNAIQRINTEFKEKKLWKLR